MAGIGRTDRPGGGAGAPGAPGATLPNRTGIHSAATLVPLTRSTWGGATRHVPDGFGMVLIASPENTSHIYVGGADLSTANGYVLPPGESIILYVQTIQQVWFMSPVSGQIIQVMVEV